MLKFEKLKDTDYKLIKSFAQRSFFQSSFYCPASILMWNDCLNSYNFCTFKDALLIMELDEKYKDKKRLLMPFSEKPFSPEELAEILKASDTTSFYYCPEHYFEKDISSAKSLFNIYIQEGATDYLYTAEDLSQLKGAKYSKKRNLISQFEKNYLENGLVETLILNRINVADILELSKEWKDAKEAEELMDIMECEFKAIEKALKNWDELELFGISIYIDKKISGFAVGSFLNNEVADLNFEKARKDIKGLYQFLDREFAKSLPPEYTIVNKETDMGKEGLAKAKSSYHPIKKPKSYILELKQDRK